MHLLLKLPLFATCFLTAWATPASSAAHQLSSRSPPTDPSGYPVDFWEKGDRARYRKNAPRFPFRKPRTEAYEEDQSTVDEADEAIRDCWATWLRERDGWLEKERPPEEPFYDEDGIRAYYCVLEARKRFSGVIDFILKSPGWPGTPMYERWLRDNQLRMTSGPNLFETTKMGVSHWMQQTERRSGATTDRGSGGTNARPLPFLFGPQQGGQRMPFMRGRVGPPRRR